MNLACKNTILNRGVLHLIFHDEVPMCQLEGTPSPGTPKGRLPSWNIASPEDAINVAIDLLRGAKCPVIVVGHGVHFQMESIVALAEQLKAPVITTKGMGKISDSHLEQPTRLSPMNTSDQRSGSMHRMVVTESPDLLGRLAVCLVNC